MGEPTQLDRIEAMFACICVALNIPVEMIDPTAMMCRDRRIKQEQEGGDQL